MKRCSICGRDIDGETVKEDYCYIEEKGYDKSLIGDDVAICHDCARKERVKEKEEGYMESLEGFFRLAGFTNFNEENMSAEALARAFARQHRECQGQILLFLFRAFEKIAALDDGWIDLRNEWGYKWIRRAVKSDELAELAEQISRMTEYDRDTDNDAELVLNQLISKARKALKRD